MAIQPPKLKLQPLPKVKRDRQLVPKLLGTHHFASATPFWVDRITEAKVAKNRLKPSDFEARKLLSFRQPFGEKSSGLTYQMLHPKFENKHGAPGEQAFLNSYNLKMFTQLADNNPNLGLSFDDLLKLRLIGGTNTNALVKQFVISLSGGLNPNCRYGSLAYGYGEPGQLKRLAEQERLGKAPDLEPKLVQDCESLGLTPILDEHHIPRLVEPHYAPRLTPSHP